MKVSNIRHLIIGIAMLAAAGLALALTHRVKTADQVPGIDLESMIPIDIGEWRFDKSVVPVQASEYLRSIANRIYSQTLARTYVNSDGYRIMLSIAYGGTQNDDLQVHRPETCYAAQGFQVQSGRKDEISSPYGQLSVKRMQATQGSRVEPITYWITVGNKVATSGIEQKLAQMSYTLTGKVPDGMLVRVSSIDRDEPRAFKIQDDFVRQMLTNASNQTRARLIGE